MVISNLVLTRQIYSEETNGAHAHYREPVPLRNHEETFKPSSLSSKQRLVSWYS